MYEKFEKLRQEKNVSVYEVSKATGLSSTFFSEWKKGKSKMPRVENLKKLADYFDTTVDAFI